MDADSKTVQCGTAAFIKELSARQLPSAEDIILKMEGEQLTVPFLHENGFNDPILIAHKDGLGMIMPPETFTVDDVEFYVGAERKVDVIDVARQEGVRMKLGDFIQYFKNPIQNKVMNLISLEFTGTLLCSFVEAPLIARSLDWLNHVWPKDVPNDGRPTVEKYCLISTKGSYTDFHIDFGGSSVWYHILWGEKIFYLIRPEETNLTLYYNWAVSATKSETFFGDRVENCYKLVLKQGQTMLLPTGWIHAVLTPEDSLVFGGNFLHSLNMQLQLQVYEMEKNMKIPRKFQYPAFEKMHWLAAVKLLEDLKQGNARGAICPIYFLQGLKALVITLKQWSQEKDPKNKRKEEIPAEIDSRKLCRDLKEETQQAEKLINSLNHPQRRVSKRRKNRSSNEDYVYY